MSDGECLTVFENVHDVSSFDILHGDDETDQGTVSLSLNTIEYMGDAE